MSQANSHGQTLAWRTSSRSMGGGECVQVATGAGKVLVRDSKDQAGPALAYPSDVWRKFLRGAKQL